MISKPYLKHVCVSLSGKNFQTCVQQLRGVELAELRLDLTEMNPDEIALLTSQGQEWIITVREELLRKKDFELLFAAALNEKVRFVDIDFALWYDDRIGPLLQQMRSTGIRLMLSYHNFEITPSYQELVEIGHKMSEAGAHALKVVCMASSEDDAARVLQLYDVFDNITAFCMGDIARKSRIDALSKGIKISYCRPDLGESTAQGQYAFSEMCALAEQWWQKGEANE